MGKSNSVIPKKKRGRPATGRDPLTALRLPPPLLKAVETWATKQTDEPNRSEAIRRLVERGLKIKTPARPAVSKPARKLRAQELATNAIEKIIDPSAFSEERVDRQKAKTK
jgi:hypothetical protein